MNRKVSDQDFIAAWHRAGASPSSVATLLGVAERTVFQRRVNLAKRGIRLETIDPLNRALSEFTALPGGVGTTRLEHTIKNGTAIIFSDAHFWPGAMTLANKALLKLIKDLSPSLVIANGDLLDGVSISRHPPIGWQETPTLKEEIEAVQDHMHEIALALPNKCKSVRTIGNHDHRFDRFLATNANQFKGLRGTTLAEYLPRWEECWSFYINGGSVQPVMVKHRFNNGVHAVYNNTLRSGTTIVTGHLHRLIVTPWGDYLGRRWGVDTGTLSDPHGPQFLYAEDNPTPHCAGFAVLTWVDGALLPPELCEVYDGKAHFRGKIIIQA